MPWKNTKVFARARMAVEAQLSYHSKSDYAKSL